MITGARGDGRYTFIPSSHSLSCVAVQRAMPHVYVMEAAWRAANRQKKKRITLTFLKGVRNIPLR